MASTVPLVNRSPGDLLTTTLWNTYVAANLNKLLNQGHRKVTVAQFAALTDIEDGDEVYLEVDSTNGIEWHLVYRSAEATYKWRFLGGPPMGAAVDADEGTASTDYAGLATAGPSVALPRAGDYEVRQEAEAGNTGAGVQHASYDIGATGAVDSDEVRQVASASGQNSAGSRSRRNRLTAVTLLSKYKTSAGTGSWRNRRIVVTPVRLRHDA